MDGAVASDLNRIVTVDREALPLVVDLDRALRIGEPHLESAIDCLRVRPLQTLKRWLAATWHRQALASQPTDATSAQHCDPLLDPRLIALLQGSSRDGRPVYLLTRADKAAAEAIAHRLEFVTGVLVDGRKAEKPDEASAQALRERFPDGFDYAGNTIDALPIWRAARHAVLVRASAQVTAAVALTTPIVAHIAAPSTASALLSAVRPRQWLKNLLVAVPLALAGQLGDMARTADVALAIFALCLITGATYLVNDIWDLPHDRRHWSKRNRALASGRLQLHIALWAAPLMMLAGLLVGGAIGPPVLGCLMLYIAGTFAYSFKLKQLPLIDAATLGGLFTIRLAIGITAANVAISPWLLVFSMFLFTSLGFAKRSAELAKSNLRGLDTLAGRGYRGSDAPMVLALGLAAALSAVLILVLYIIEDVMTLGVYRNKLGLWCLPPLLYLLVGRIWLKSHRGEMEDDPIEFLVHDRTSLWLMLLMVVCFCISWYGPAIR